jgi:general secretion pathway protein A
VKALIDTLTARLLEAHAAGRRVAVLIDEAHLLERDVLEQVRLLTNIETATRKLLQVILIGQPELRELLAREDMRQVAQRITGRLHLDPLSEDETAAYVRHRLRVAGATREIFTSRALRELHRQAGGLPRLVNVIADRAMLGAYAKDRHEITPALVRAAASEVSGIERRSRKWIWLATAATVIVIAISVALFLQV